MSEEKLTLTQALAAFVQERNWERYHNAKSFACAVCAEAGELMDTFVWVNDNESDQLKHQPEALANIRQEAADVYICLLQLARHLDFNLEQAAWDKLAEIKKRYPAQVGGTAEYRKNHTYANTQNEEKLHTPAVLCLNSEDD